MPADSNSRMGTDNAPENMLASSPGTSSLRQRTDSESSEKITRFILPSMDGSPPKVMSINEVAHVVKNIQNMELAHEIALNPEFKLQPYEPPENSLEHRIKAVMHKAFWDVLREQLKETPPCYKNAIQLLADIKECFPQILSPNNNRALDHINEVLDASVIQQQAEKGVLDFKSYADFVIQIMAKSCAPARDKAVKSLEEIEDIVDIFKGILDTMTLMKLDMANFLLDLMRNDIMANSVEYEKEKFKEYLEYYKFGFPATEEWLQRNRIQDAENAPSAADQSIYNAYMALMDWDETKEFPEVLSIDKERILKLGQRANCLCVCASIISVCAAVPILAQRSQDRIELTKHFEILLQGAKNESEIAEAIGNIWVQVKVVINDILNRTNQPNMGTAIENVLKTQIFQITKKDSPVRALMWKRLQTYFRLFLRSKSGLPAPPPGYADYKDELESYATALKRVIIYNHSVFGEYFTGILMQQRPDAEPINEDGATTPVEKDTSN